MRFVLGFFLDFVSESDSESARSTAGKSSPSASSTEADEELEWYSCLRNLFDLFR